MSKNLKEKTVQKVVMSLFILNAIGLISQPQLAKAEEHGLLLETDKNIYTMGENITIILTNNGNEAVEIGGYPAWEILTYAEGEHACPVIYASLLWELDPEESDTFVWNQFNLLNSTFVGPGTYALKDVQGWGLVASFEIVAAKDAIPEFSSATILSLFVVSLTFIVVLAQKYNEKH